jgi:hypothetical protein
MTRMTLKARVGADGVLHVPLGPAEANREVNVTIEPAASSPAQSRQEYLEFLRTTAGAWQVNSSVPIKANTKSEIRWDDLPPGRQRLANPRQP